GLRWAGGHPAGLSGRPGGRVSLLQLWRRDADPLGGVAVVGSFEVTAQDPTSAARCGRLVTAHGAVEPAAFMPVGTQATVKTLSSEDLEEQGASMLLGNSYHLALRPGAERTARLGALRRFMSWSRGILTDSRGFHVMSLSSLRRVHEDGVTLRSQLECS